VCAKCVQRVPRSSKKADVEKQSQFDPAQAAHAQDQAVDSTTDEHAAYIAAWRVDKALQLAADISNLCTSSIVVY